MLVLTRNIPSRSKGQIRNKAMEKWGMGHEECGVGHRARGKREVYVSY